MPGRNDGKKMAQENKTCSKCGEKGHSKFYCKNTPRTPIRASVKPSSVKKVKVTTKRKKSTPRALAKKKAWEAFSLYIRTRDCIRFTGDPEQGMCVTCKSFKPRKELQAGHFVGGRGNAVLFDERLVYSQDGYCNQKPPMGLGGGR